jgi:hypothetical protein
MKWLLLLALAACGSSDPCERAIARLERINGIEIGAARPSMIEQCRTNKSAQWDPVLRCAMDSATDDDAKKCIDRGIRDVVTPGDGTQGAGLNPLMQ